MHNDKYLREEILRMSGVNTSKCMKCGKCSATCPAYDEMEYHPHQFVGMVETGDIAPLLSSDSLYTSATPPTMAAIFSGMFLPQAM